MRRTARSAARAPGSPASADLSRWPQLILRGGPGRQSAEELARPFIGEGVPTVEEALAGARDIVAETISDHPDVRRETRERAWRFGHADAPRRSPRRKISAASSRRTMPSRCRSGGCGPIRRWRSIGARRRRFCASASRCRSATGARRSGSPSAPTRARRWPRNWPWRSMTPPSACCSRRSSATCAANCASGPRSTRSASSPPTCAAC